MVHVSNSFVVSAVSPEESKAPYPSQVGTVLLLPLDPSLLGMVLGPSSFSRGLLDFTGARLFPQTSESPLTSLAPYIHSEGLVL